MENWWKLGDGNYVNPAQCRSIYTDNTSGSWQLYVDINATANRLAGTWPSEAAAQEAARELVQGVDVATYGD